MAPPAIDGDKASAKAAQLFCAEVTSNAGVVKALADMVRAAHEVEARAAAVAALRELIAWGGVAVRDGVVAANFVPELVDSIKSRGSDDATFVAAASALSGLTYSPLARAQILDLLVAYMKPSSAALAVTACLAAAIVVGDSPENAAHLGTNGGVRSLLELVAAPDPALQLAGAQMLVQALRNSAENCDAAAAAGAVGRCLVPRLKSLDAATAVAAAAAAGFVARRSAEQREPLAGAVADLIEVVTKSPVATWGWEDAVGAAAVLAIYHDGARPAVVKAMRVALSRGASSDAAAAALAASRMSMSPKGREALLAEGCLPSLVSVLTAGSPAARAAAADALTNLAAPAFVQLEAAGGREARRLDPKAEVVKAGAVSPLVALVRSDDEACIIEAAEALYCLAAIEMGRDAVRSAGGVEALNEVAQRGKRKEVSERAAKAVYEALMRVL